MIKRTECFAYWLLAVAFLRVYSCTSTEFQEFKSAFVGHLFSDSVHYGNKFGCNASRIHVSETVTRKLPPWLIWDEEEGILQGIPQESDLDTFDLMIVGIALIDGHSELLCKQFVWTITVLLEPKSLPVALISYINNETDFRSDQRDFSKCLSESRLTLLTLSFAVNTTVLSKTFTRLLNSMNSSISLPTGLIQIVESSSSIVFFKQLHKLKILRFERLGDFYSHRKEFYVSWPLGCERNNFESFDAHEIHKRSLSTISGLRLNSWHVTSGELDSNLLIRKRRGIFFGSITALEGTPAVTSVLPSHFLSSAFYTSVGSASVTNRFTSAASKIIEPSFVTSQANSYLSAAGTISDSSIYATPSLEVLSSTPASQRSDISSRRLLSETARKQDSASVLLTNPTATLTQSTVQPTSILLSSQVLLQSSPRKRSATSFMIDGSTCTHTSCFQTSNILPSVSSYVFQSSYDSPVTEKSSIIQKGSAILGSSLKSRIPEISSVYVTPAYSSLATKVSSRIERTRVSSTFLSTQHTGSYAYSNYMPSSQVASISNSMQDFIKTTPVLSKSQLSSFLTSPTTYSSSGYSSLAHYVSLTDYTSRRYSSLAHNVSSSRPSSIKVSASLPISHEPSLTTSLSPSTISVFSSFIRSIISSRYSFMTSSASLFQPSTVLILPSISVSSRFITAEKISASTVQMTLAMRSSSLQVSKSNTSSLFLDKKSSFSTAVYTSSDSFKVPVTSFGSFWNSAPTTTALSPRIHLSTQGVKPSTTADPSSYVFTSKLLHGSSKLPIKSSTLIYASISSFMPLFSRMTQISHGYSSASIRSTWYATSSMQSTTKISNTLSSIVMSRSSLALLTYSSLLSSTDVIRTTISKQASSLLLNTTLGADKSSFSSTTTPSNVRVSTLATQFGTRTSQRPANSSMRVFKSSSLLPRHFNSASFAVTPSIHSLSISNRKVTCSYLETFHQSSGTSSSSSNHKGTAGSPLLSESIRKTPVATTMANGISTSRSALRSSLSIIAHHSSSGLSRVSVGLTSRLLNSIGSISSFGRAQTSLLPLRTTQSVGFVTFSSTVVTSLYNRTTFKTALLSSSNSLPSPSTVVGPVTKIPDTVPRVVNSIGRIVAYVGRMLIYKIPADTFYDREDGWTSNLTLVCRYLDGRKIDASFWVHFDNTSQTLSGLPFLNDYNSQGSVGVGIQIIAQDRKGNVAKDVLNIYIERQPVDLQFTISLRILRSYREFLANSSLKLVLFNRVITFYNASRASSYYGSSLVNGSVIFSWSDTTIAGSVCNKAAIVATLGRLQSSSGSTDAAFAQWMSPEFPVLGITLSYLGVCHSTSTPVVTAGPRAGTTSNQDFVTYVVPAIAVAAVLAFIIGTVIFITRRRRMKPSFFEKDTFKHGQPVLLPEEYELDCFYEPNITLPERYIPAGKAKEPDELSETDIDGRPDSDDENNYVDNPTYGLNVFSKPPPPYPRAASRESSRRSSYESPYSRPPPAYQLPMPYVHPDFTTSEV